MAASHVLSEPIAHLEKADINLDEIVNMDSDNSNKRPFHEDSSENENFSPVKQSNPKLSKLNSSSDISQEASAKKSTIQGEIINMETRASTFYVKGVNGSNITSNPSKTWKYLLEVDPRLSTTQITKGKDYLQVNCVDAQQVKMISKLTRLGEFDVVVSDINPAGQNSMKPYPYEVIIFGVHPDITPEEIMKDTGAGRARRLPSTRARPEISKTVVLSFGSCPPDRVFIGFQSYRTSTYIPRATCCFKCQKFGHTSKYCNSSATCPICAAQHSYDQCREKFNPPNGGSRLCANCGGSHSAAYKECIAFKKATKITEIKTTEKISYAEAARKYRNIVLQDSRRDYNQQDSSSTTYYNHPGPFINDPHDTIPEEEMETLPKIYHRSYNSQTYCSNPSVNYPPRYDQVLSKNLSQHVPSSLSLPDSRLQTSHTEYSNASSQVQVPLKSLQFERSTHLHGTPQRARPNSTSHVEGGNSRMNSQDNSHCEYRSEANEININSYQSHSAASPVQEHILNMLKSISSEDLTGLLWLIIDWLIQRCYPQTDTRVITSQIRSMLETRREVVHSNDTQILNSS